ncbi:MAG: multidrug efflux SMR transporter [Paenibacillus macerans]|uniref:EamA family transporter n=1 Tax=Paenibacillus macerans TaxID=44252 RepID=A0A090ZJG3_PAEMA|nr:multidrug efflux SMR transporter [Paenibacillus macerans]KFN10762.1 quaternary ammonium compound-resistance protein qacC [Paenibacillus macerans]MBS5914150.1 multidrug efflux SMR transporter [Paenibacillus macerans]MDU7477921.1 multidrug efflux SMR transporter [Paenibacillus macerans]MEC0138366.1 multidrug efflux SMR transporter [Paenibacillus macerans]MEC0152852.1 multidrug efflux SMR transporter [Paenibacillus macerans]
MAYLFLMISIASELIGTSMLKASQGFTKLAPSIITVAAFVCAFYFLSLSLKTIPLNAAYAIWSGLGSVLTVIISVLIWKEKINAGSIVGIALIIAGVVILQMLGPGHGSSNDEAKQEAAIVQKE